GTGLGTSILIEDVRTGKYRPIPGEGGHVDFEAVDELEFRAAGWIRKHINRSPGNPMDRERIVSGPGLVNLYRALSELEPGDGNPRIAAEVVKADVYDRPAVIIQHAGRDTRCRRTLDIWLRCYARAAKNSPIVRQGRSAPRPTRDASSRRQPPEPRPGFVPARRPKTLC